MLRPVSGSRSQGRIAVIDIGSNSLRLVVFDGATRSPVVLLNEKVLCGLGRGLSSTGRLNPEGIELALATLQRFVALARAVDAGRQLHVLATAAVRDASDGGEFVLSIERLCRVKVRILGGDAEGRFSALGVVSGMPEAEGIVGDLGGGSVELVPVAAGEPGPSVTLPLGPLRLAPLQDSEKKLREAIDEAVEGVPFLARARDRDFYLVGGAWRALARVHMEYTNYPLHIIQHYAVPRAEAEDFLQLLGRQSKKSLERIAGVSRKRLESIPLAAFLLQRLLRAIAPKRLVFSAFGLREGLVYDLLPADARAEDPLISAASDIATERRRFGMTAEELVDWTAEVFPADRSRARLRLAAALLSDSAWAEHPDYRAESAFLRALHLPVGGMDHAERVYLASALHARYGGDPDAALVAPRLAQIGGDGLQEARSFGLALRLAYTMTGGVPGLLARSSLTLEEGALALALDEDAGFLAGDGVQRRLDALGRSLGRRTVLTPASPPPPARGAARA